jgi:hypothetical protein
MAVAIPWPRRLLSKEESLLEAGEEVETLGSWGGQVLAHSALKADKLDPLDQVVLAGQAMPQPLPEGLLQQFQEGAEARQTP